MLFVRPSTSGPTVPARAADRSAPVATATMASPPAPVPPPGLAPETQGLAPGPVRLPLHRPRHRRAVTSRCAPDPEGTPGAARVTYEERRVRRKTRPPS